MRDDDSATAGVLERARAGDKDAFSDLVGEHVDRVWSLVWRILRNREDTEDVVQEVFLTAWRSLPGFRGEASLSTWLGRIAVTRALNHLDRGAERVRRASVSLDAAPAGGAVPDGGGPAARGWEPAEERAASCPLRSLEARELRRRLARCLDRLPAAWRAALALRHAGARSYEEMAAALGVALGTVRSRLARARLALKNCLEEGS